MVEKHDDPTPKSAPAKPAPPPAAPPGGGPDHLKTEQEKGKPDPIDKPVPPGPIPESIEDQGIGPRQPYPSKGG